MKKELRFVSLIDAKAVIERILHHLGLWQQGVCVAPSPDPHGDLIIEPWLNSSAAGQAEQEDTIPIYDTDPERAASDFRRCGEYPVHPKAADWWRS